jgi:hypothetical protein
MMHPIVSNMDLGEYEMGDVVRLAISSSSPGAMSSWDSLARAIGHDYEYESDGQGAAASAYALTATDRRLFAIAATLDHVRSRYSRWVGAAPNEWDNRPTMLHAGPYAPIRAVAPDLVGSDWVDGPATHAYVRSDDRGFWSMIPTTADGAATMLAGWVAENVPDYCEVCGATIDDDATVRDACPSCLAAMGHDDEGAHQ